jgi:hypothetical protein
MCGKEAKNMKKPLTISCAIGFFCFRDIAGHVVQTPLFPPLSKVIEEFLSPG